MSSIGTAVYGHGIGCLTECPREIVARGNSCCFQPSPSLDAPCWRNTPKRRRVPPLRAKSGSEPFSWESLKKAIEDFKQGSSVQDFLREQMQEKEFSGNGGGKPPSGGGDGFGGPENEDFGDELLQLTVATLGFVLLYIYITRGQALTEIAIDYINYKFRGRIMTQRLRDARKAWRDFIRSIRYPTRVKEDWLACEIARTCTWWHHPRELLELDIELKSKNQQAKYQGG